MMDIWILVFGHCSGNATVLPRTVLLGAILFFSQVQQSNVSFFCFADLNILKAVNGLSSISSLSLDFL